MAHDLILERAREPCVVPGPRDRRDDHTVPLATHPRRFGLEVRERRPEVQRAPSAAAFAPVIARAAAPATRAAIALARRWTDRHHQRSAVGERDVLDDRSLKAEQLLPYASPAYAVTALSCGSATVRSRNRKSTTACAPPARRSGAPSAPTSLPNSAARRRLSSSANPSTSSTNVPLTTPAPRRCLIRRRRPRYPATTFTSPTERAGEPNFMATSGEEPTAIDTHTRR